jgi:hypothetical protein
MTDTTTIEIPVDLRDTINEKKRHDKEPYYSVIQREMGEEWSEGQPDNPITQEDIDDIKNQLSMANEPAVELDVDELISRIDKLESAVMEATQAAQNAEKKVEDLQQ